MFKFLLKRKTGLGNSGIFFILSLLSVFLCIFLSSKYINQEYDSFIILLVWTPSIFIFLGGSLIKKLIKNYRENTPYKTYTIKEDNKELEVRDYPTLYMKEHYYNGKLHRENGMAVEIHSFYSACKKHGDDFFYLNNIRKGFFYLNDKKQTYEEFIENLPKVRIQNKALSF